VSFLHAWGIALGLAAIVPLILHLRRRQTDRRISFPALRYLSSAEDARSRSLVASDVLLLACRIGLLAALALAAAGPLLGRGGASDHTPTDLALVIDNSASTGRLVDDRPLFEEILTRARASLANTRPEDRVWIFPTVGAPVAAGVSGGRAAESLDRVEPADGGADLRDAVVRASSALPADRDRRREVQLISDLQRGALGGAPDDGEDDADLVAYVPPAPDEPNAAVAEIQLTGGTTVPSGIGHGVIVRATRLGASAGQTDSVSEASIRLQLDGRIAGATRTAWGATGTLGLPELATGTHEGRVEVDPAGARADDTRFFSIHVVAPPGVRFVGPDTSFARMGVETLRQARRLGAEAGATVTVIEGAGVAGRGATDEEGTLVLIPPADPVDIPAFNQMLAGLDIGWTLRVDPGRGSLAIDEPDAAFSLSGINVHQRYLLRPGTGTAAATDSSILHTEDGEAWLVRTTARSKTALLLGSPLVPQATDLPTHPAVLPFLEALLVQWSHLSGWPSSDFDAGAEIPLPAWARTITAPNQSVESVEGGQMYTATRAGIYRVDGGDAAGAPRQAHFAVNVPESELDPTAVSPDELAEIFPGRDVFTGGPAAGEWSDEIFRGRRGRDTAPWLLGLALALGALELFLATPGRARKRAEGSDRWSRTEPELEGRTGST
jgi:hypothetical protein